LIPAHLALLKQRELLTGSRKENSRQIKAKGREGLSEEGLIQSAAS